MAIFNFQTGFPSAKAMAACMAILYLAASFQWADLVRIVQHNHEQEAIEGWACATHKCACKGPKECKLHCCCKIKGGISDGESRQPREKDVLTWSQCTGPSSDLALVILRLAPHCFQLILIEPPPSSESSVRLVRTDAVLSRPPQPLLKVPILSPLS